MDGLLASDAISVTAAAAHQSWHSCSSTISTGTSSTISTGQEVCNCRPRQKALPGSVFPGPKVVLLPLSNDLYRLYMTCFLP